MWKSLGFRRSPYNTSPLKAVREDVELLVGRSKEMVEMCTQFESAEQGVYIISGKPGVGKTSFFNIAQFLLEEEEASFGPRILCAHSLCPIQPSDNSLTIARRAVMSVVQSAEHYCAVHRLDVPPNIQQVSKWMQSKGGEAGFQISLSVMGTGAGFGRTVTLPSFYSIEYEGLQKVLATISEEIVVALDFEGAFIVLDNIENLGIEQITKLLVGFRDTLFTTPRIWWVLIGQAGLSSLIKTAEPKVHERLSGVGRDLEPIGLREMHEAIEKRVQKFHQSGDGKAPLPEKVHRHLYNASRGEIRFVFKYSHEICTQFIAGIRTQVLKESHKMTPAMLDNALGRVLVKGLIPDDIAERVLKHIVKEEIDALQLTEKERLVLARIGLNGSARASDFRDYDVESSVKFSANYLVKMHRQFLLVRSMQGKSFNYQLCGMLSLGAEYKVL